jgi:protein arginine N-methyltransferase 1
MLAIGVRARHFVLSMHVQECAAMFIEFHRNLIADHVRNAAFFQALREVIRPGETTVADLGSGTGLLGFYAARLGAKDVYFYEYSPALKLSQKIARQNGLRRCHFIHAHSRQVADPIPVDVIVSETLGNFAYEENIIENLADARRFLKPGGVMIPQRVEQFVTPVIAARYFDELCAWNHIEIDVDFSTAREMSLNNLYVRSFRPDDLFDEGRQARRWDHVDLRKKNGSVRRGSSRWVVDRRETIYGFALWWECELLPGIALSTNPQAARTHWEHLYCPVLEPISAHPGDALELTLVSDSRYEVGASMKWEITLRRNTETIAHQSLDMKRGDLA